MGFAFLDSYWFEPRPRAARCPKCRGVRGAIIVQFSLNVNSFQSLKEPICPKCERRWAEKTYPPIQWERDGRQGVRGPLRPPGPLKSAGRQRRKKSS